MLRKITWVTVPLMAIALAMTTDTSTAEANGFGIQVGRFGFSSHGYGGYGRYGGYGGYGGHKFRSYGVPSYRNFAPRYRSYHGGGYYHNRRPHLDWHGPSLIPHGNHYDYIPGHWDVHYGRHHH